jgi:hypothetical protein
MKIVRKSNFDHEDHRGNQHFVEIVHRTATSAVTVPMSKRDAEAIAKCLNDLAGRHNDDFYDVVNDDYALPPDWEP